MVSYNEFKNAVLELKETHGDGTFNWKFGYDRKNTWAIVLGWQGGFEENNENPYHEEEYCICAKVAYQPTNSMMQCGYDIDWLMPYNEETSEVYDTEISIDDDMSIYNAYTYLVTIANSYLKLLIAV